jgi:hypothetical protein
MMKYLLSVCLIAISTLIFSQSIKKTRFRYFEIDISSYNFSFIKEIEDAGCEFVSNQNPNDRFLVNRYKYLPSQSKKVADNWIKDLIEKSGGIEKKRTTKKITIDNLPGFESISQINVGDRIFYTDIITLEDKKFIYTIATLSDNQNFLQFRKIAKTFGLIR